MPRYFSEIYKRWKNDEMTAVKAAKMLNLSKSTFYRKVRETEKNK